MEEALGLKEPLANFSKYQLHGLLRLVLSGRKNRSRSRGVLAEAGGEGSGRRPAALPAPRPSEDVGGSCGAPAGRAGDSPSVHLPG